MPAVETVDVKHNWNRVCGLAIAMLNSGIDAGAECKATPDELLAAANLVVLELVKQGTRGADKHVIIERLRITQRMFTNDLRSGLTPIDLLVEPAVN